MFQTPVLRPSSVKMLNSVPAIVACFTLTCCIGFGLEPDFTNETVCPPKKCSLHKCQIKKFRTNTWDHIDTYLLLLDVLNFFPAAFFELSYRTVHCIGIHVFTIAFTIVYSRSSIQRNKDKISGISTMGNFKRLGNKQDKLINKRRFRLY